MSDPSSRDTARYFGNMEPTGYADWARSDQYHNARLIKPDEALTGATTRAQENGLPPISVSAAQGKYLHLLCRSIGAKKVIEIGTLGGYSTIWMARGLPADGKVITFELNDAYAKVARESFMAAGVSDKIDIVVGAALDTLPTALASSPSVDGTFDLMFIDADKENNLGYFKHAERLVRPGGVIIVDNVVRYGRVAKTEEFADNTDCQGVRRLLEYIKDNAGVEATTISTVGEKGYDGFMYAVKL